MAILSITSSCQFFLSTRSLAESQRSNRLHPRFKVASMMPPKMVRCVVLHSMNPKAWKTSIETELEVDFRVSPGHPTGNDGEVIAIQNMTIVSNALVLAQCVYQCISSILTLAETAPAREVSLILGKTTYLLLRPSKRRWRSDCPQSSEPDCFDLSCRRPHRTLQSPTLCSWIILDQHGSTGSTCFFYMWFWDICHAVTWWSWYPRYFRPGNLSFLI